MQAYEDIPRLYTALAEWGACVVYLLLAGQGRRSMLSFYLPGVLFLAAQTAFLVLTGDLPTVLWIPSMAMAAGLMFCFLLTCGSLTPRIAGYCCAKAFILAELAASLEWQLHMYMKAAGFSRPLPGLLLFVSVYGLCFGLALRLEKPLFTREYLSQLTRRELWSAVGIVLVVFAFSNLSFVIEDSPFTSRLRSDIFNIRTLADLAGVAILHAYQSRICEYAAEKELAQMNAVLKTQYDQYRNYQDSVELIHMKHHDLKHQIAGLRAETDEQRRKEWLDSMEEEIAAFENLNRTGNQVLDTILGAKIFHCRKHKIQITCVANGALLGFMHVTDICSVFGNALDNAIESVVTIPEEEKRLIHVQVTEKRGFLFIQVENCCAREAETAGDGLPSTTKEDTANHGFGLRSIRRSVEKYGGTMSAGMDGQWFELKILIPLAGSEGGESQADGSAPEI